MAIRQNKLMPTMEPWLSLHPSWLSHFLHVAPSQISELKSAAHPRMTEKKNTLIRKTNEKDLNSPAPSLNSSFRQFSGWRNFLQGSVHVKFVCFSSQLASTRLSQWKHFRRFSGRIRKFEPSPAEMAHCDEAVLLRHVLDSPADNCPPQPLTVAPLAIFAKH